MSETVFVVRAVGVHYRGLIGVFTDRATAEAEAQAAYDQSDRYHEIQVVEYPMNEAVDLDNGEIRFGTRLGVPSRRRTGFVRAADLGGTVSWPWPSDFLP